MYFDGDIEVGLIDEIVKVDLNELLDVVKVRFE